MTDQGSLSAARLQPRRATRHKLFEPVILRCDGVALRAHILDLSASGALLHCDCAPKVGDAVGIRADMFNVAARVMWVRDKRFGVRFDLQLCEEAIRLSMRA